MDLKKFIRDIPDYPKPGIIFKDLTPLWKDKEAFRHSIKLLASRFVKDRIDAVAGAEARGFLVGAAVAYELGVGFIPVRKPNKLPFRSIQVSYTLEYGTDTLEMHEDALDKGRRVLIVDDLIATGGTAGAAAKLIRRLGGTIIGAAFIIDLPDLGGARALERDGIRVQSLMSFEGH